MFPDAIVLRPAYGRHYSTAAEALKDWRDGKDFSLPNGQYCSIRDKNGLLNDYGDYIMLSYSQFQTVTAESKFVY
jgi:hypothetical protein